MVTSFEKEVTKKTLHGELYYNKIRLPLIKGAGGEAAH